MVLVDRKIMPKTHEELKDWVIEKSREKDYLILTDVAIDVADIISGGPVPRHIKPIWPFIALQHSILYLQNLKIYMVLEIQNLKPRC